MDGDHSFVSNAHSVITPKGSYINKAISSPLRLAYFKQRASDNLQEKEYDITTPATLKTDNDYLEQLIKNIEEQIKKNADESRREKTPNRYGSYRKSLAPFNIFNAEINNNKIILDQMHMQLARVENRNYQVSDPEYMMAVENKCDDTK